MRGSSYEKRANRVLHEQHDEDKHAGRDEDDLDFSVRETEASRAKLL